MKFEAVPIEQAQNHILGHNIADGSGRRLLRKGRPVSAENVAQLRALGYETVYVALRESDDVDENAAAQRISQRAAGAGIRLSKAATGRVNMFAISPGLLEVDPARLAQINFLEGVTLATLPRHAVVSEGKMAATLKIIPYALPDRVVGQAVTMAQEPLLYVKSLRPKRVGLILSGSPAVQTRVTNSFLNALSARVSALHSTIEEVEYVPLEDEKGELQLTATVEGMIGRGMELILLAGETAIMDRYDISPRAVERAGGQIASFGAPVDPGNLLMLAYIGAVPIVGAPGCVRSPKLNIIDMVLPRLLVGERLDEADIVALALGGLLEDVPERPLPRSRLS